MTSTHDVADLTSSLLDWVRDVLPDADVRAASSADGDDGAKPKSDKDVAVRLARIQGLTGDRSGEAVSRKLQLEYAFGIQFADPIAGHQALADLAFAMLERDDLGGAGDAVRGDNGALFATFVLHRRRDLPRAKPVRETKISLPPQAQVTGSVHAENGFPIARAQIHVRNSDRLIITGND